MKKKKEKTIIGWREMVDLPEWRIKGLRAKIDTGAKTSSLHVEDIRELPHDHIEFHVVLSESRAHKRVIAKRVRLGHVKSSIGVKTSRWYVATTLRLGKFKKKVPINLISRQGMNFRMLIGRNALKGNFIVDVGKSFLVTPPKKRRKKRLRK